MDEYYYGASKAKLQATSDPSVAASRARLAASDPAVAAPKPVGHCNISISYFDASAVTHIGDGGLCLGAVHADW